MKILKNGNTYSLVENAVEVINDLPLGVYDISQDSITHDFFLLKRDDTKFTIPKKIYGNYDEIVNKIIKTYHILNKNLGALFIGEKGTGKTLLTKRICNLIEKPVIIISIQFRSGNLTKFLNDLNCEVVILIDEFEKIYNEEDQKQLLSLMDGTNNNKFLFLLTANNHKAINFHLQNRPSRIRYYLDFKSLDASAITELINDKLVNFEKHGHELNRLVNIIGRINYDMLETIIHEINTFDNSNVNILLENLNLFPEASLFKLEASNSKGWSFEKIFNGNPMRGDFNINEHWLNKKGHFISIDPEKGPDSDVEYCYENIKLTECTSIDITNEGYEIKFQDILFKFKKVDRQTLIF